MVEQKTILVVDDENQLRLTLALILKQDGYQVQTAANATEALQCLQEGPFDLMFLDLNMPGMNGIDLLVEIHRLFPKLPVLILTAHATLDSAIQAVRLGARDYLIKPIDPPLILARVAEVIAEGEQPVRKKEIVNQLQNLLAELQEMDGVSTTPTHALATLPPTDAGRFLQKGPLALDLHARHVTMNNQYILVTGVYFDYLVTLVRHAPMAVSHRALVKESQGFDVTTTEARDLARWRIHELRRIIEEDPQRPKYILTVRGTGYRLAI